MDVLADASVPQWKRDLILRLREKNKWPSDDQQQLLAGTQRNTSAAVGRTGQQPSPTCSSAVEVSTTVPVASSQALNGDCAAVKCNENSLTCTCTKMVKERVLMDYKQFNNFETANNILDNEDAESGSSEELHYGPGIVNRLKNRYLSLTLRENNVKVRPSILPMRKATSLEHLLDDDVPNGKPPMPNSRIFQSRCKENEMTKNASNRYYNAARGGDLKRARSVETISRSDDQQQTDPLVRLNKHDDMLIIKDGSDKHSGKLYDNRTLEITTTETKSFSSSVNHIINRPKRIAPVMSEKEKPPVDVVKQTKRIFEGKAEQRTRQPHQTGEVAAKVASYKNIIGQTRNNKKPPILKQKPVINQLPLNKTENGWAPEEKSSKVSSPDVASIARSSPIPDISRINSSNNREESGESNQSKTGSSLSETPDLILHSSPAKNASSPSFKILATDNFLKAEIVHSNVNNFRIKWNHETEKSKSTTAVPKAKPSSPSTDEQDGTKSVSIESRNNIRQAGNTVTYNLSNSRSPRSHLPTSTVNNKKETAVNARTLSAATAAAATTTTTAPVTGNKSAHVKPITNGQLLSPTSISKPFLPTPQPTTNLTPQEIEKNHINTAKTLEQTVVVAPVPAKREEIKKIEVPKTRETPLPRDTKEQNSIVFKFTDRKDVPDYVGNDGRIRMGKIEKPKVGEGGIILLPGASLDESVTDDDDDWMLSLEGPPSPCDVVFINDNILIDGRSSLNQKNKKAKMKIKFVDSVPEIFEYPSEASLLDDIPTPPPRESSPGHIVPTLSGSSLANYIPKSGSAEDFQLGITRSIPTALPPPPPSGAKNEENYSESNLQEVEEPVLFSAGTNSDILF